MNIDAIETETTDIVARASPSTPTHQLSLHRHGSGQAGTKQLRDGIELVRTPALVDADAVYAVCMGDGISDRAHGVSDERTARAIVAKE